MKRLKIAYSEKALEIFGAVPNREIIHTCETDYTDVAAVVITESDADVLKNEMIPDRLKVPLPTMKKTYFRLSSKILKNMWKTDIPSLTARGIRVAHSSANIRQDVFSMISSAKTFSELTSATPT